jgi:hypothetical protein
MPETKAKGYIYTLEVLLVVSIMTVSVALLFRDPPAKPEFEISTIKLQGFHALEYLNSNDNLRNIVFQGNETRLEGIIKTLLPAEVRFEAEICGLDCSDSNLPANESVVAMSYYVSGYKDAYLGRKVKLWLWTR